MNPKGLRNWKIINLSRVEPFIVLVIENSMKACQGLRNKRPSQASSMVENSTSHGP